MRENKKRGVNKGGSLFIGFGTDRRGDWTDAIDSVGQSG